MFMAAVSLSRHEDWIVLRIIAGSGGDVNKSALSG
jgi:hypothetical protein